MKHLLIDTVTIQSLTEANTSGDVAQTPVNLYENIVSRIAELSYQDRRFVESKEQYSNVIKKAFILPENSGVEDGMFLIHGSKTYIIDHVKEAQNSVGVHHYELFLSINEPT